MTAAGASLRPWESTFQLTNDRLVRWQTGGALGVCFDSELDAREVTALISRSIALDKWMKARD